MVDPETPIVSRLDHAALQRIAAAGGGQYFELDRDSDRQIVNAIIGAGRKMAPTLGVAEQAEDLYWRFIVLAGLLPFAGLLFLRDRSEMWIQVVGAAIVLTVVSTILR